MYYYNMIGIVCTIKPYIGRYTIVAKATPYTPYFLTAIRSPFLSLSELELISSWGSFLARNHAKR